MDVRLTWQFSLIVDKDEFLLISKALRGALKEVEKPDALALQERMVRQKHAILEQATDESAKVIRNIEDKKI